MKNEYLMEDERESFRLANKVDPRDLVNNNISPHVHEHDKILIIGCGPGLIAKEIALTHPSSHVTEVDISEQRIADAINNSLGIENLSFIVGDANHLYLMDNSYDIVYARFLFQYLKSPMQALGHMYRVCKPNGKVIIQDLDGQLVWHYPVDDELQKTIEEVLNYLKLTGFDPFVGRKLYNYLYRQNFMDIMVKTEVYHLYPGKINDKDYNLWKLKLDIASKAFEPILGKKSKTMINRFLDYLKREDTLTYSILFTVTGIKPE